MFSSQVSICVELVTLNFCLFVCLFFLFVSLRCRQTKPRYSPSANQRPKACSAPRVLPRFSIIGSNRLLHMAVLSCTVIGRVDLVEPWLRSRWIPDTQHKHGGGHGISVWSGEKQFELSDNLSEQRESVKDFWGQRCLCWSPYRFRKIFHLSMPANYRGYCSF